MTHYLSPPFWGGGADPDVRLWIPFTGNVSTDISSYVLGAGTATNATISGNQFTQLTGTTVQKIVWGPASSLGRSTEPWTLEAFYTWTSNDNSADAGGNLEYLVGAYGYRLKLYLTGGKLALNTPDFGDPEASTATNVLAVGKVHVALVHPPGSGPQTLRCYVAGVQVFTYLPLSGASNANGTVQIGNIQGASNGVVAIDDVRLTMRELYTGASFTPPTSPL